MQDVHLCKSSFRTSNAVLAGIQNNLIGYSNELQCVDVIFIYYLVNQPGNPIKLPKESFGQISTDARIPQM